MHEAMKTIVQIVPGFAPIYFPFYKPIVYWADRRTNTKSEYIPLPRWGTRSIEDCIAHVAGKLKKTRAENPGKRIIVIGHSSGAAASHGAIKKLPEGTIDAAVYVGGAHCGARFARFFDIVRPVAELAVPLYTDFDTSDIFRNICNHTPEPANLASVNVFYLGDGIIGPENAVAPFLPESANYCIRGGNHLAYFLDPRIVRDIIEPVVSGKLERMNAKTVPITKLYEEAREWAFGRRVDEAAVSLQEHASA